MIPLRFTLNPKQERCRVRASELLSASSFSPVYLIDCINRYIFLTNVLEEKLSTLFKEREKATTDVYIQFYYLQPLKNIIRLFKFVLKHEQNSKQHINFWPFVTKTITSFCRDIQTTWNFHRWILDLKGYRIHRSYAQND